MEERTEEFGQKQKHYPFPSYDTEKRQRTEKHRVYQETDASEQMTSLKSSEIEFCSTKQDEGICLVEHMSPNSI